MIFAAQATVDRLRRELDQHKKESHAAIEALQKSVQALRSELATLNAAQKE